MNFQHTLENNILTISPGFPAIDQRVAKEFKEKARHIVKETNFPYTILDLEEVQFIDSAGFAAMISLLKLLSEKKRELVLAALAPPIHEIFRLMDMDLIFEIYPSVPHAQKDLLVR